MTTLRAFIFFVLLLIVRSAVAQSALTVSPAFPTAPAEVTLTFDLTLAKDGRAAGLLNQSAGLYVWAWGGADQANKTAEFNPPGQTSFSQAYAPGLLTKVRENVWQIKLTPANYLTITAGKTLRWMGVLVKNANGSSQTEDFTFDLFAVNQLSVRFSTPTAKSFFVNPNTNLSVRAQASGPANLSITIDNTLVASRTDSATISATIPVGNLGGQRRRVRVSASTTTPALTASDEFTFVVSPTPPVAALPTGLKNGININSSLSATLVLFAPGKKFVYALGDFNNWEQSQSSLMNVSPDGNTFWLRIDGLKPGREFAFQYLVDGTIPVADPYSEKVLDRNNDKFISPTTYPNLLAFPAQAQGDFVSVLQTDLPAYNWKVPTFTRQTADNLVIYELHVRDFVGTQWYQTVADSLPYLKKLGINAIELMPIMEFSGNDSWGYNPIFHLAPDKAYGTRNDLKSFIDKCHQNGIAVILDMVLNQADYEFPYVKMYWDGTQPAANSPMFNQQATHPYSVFFDFNHEATATQEYVRRVNEFWLTEYKFDGFRFDLSKGFTQTKSGNDVGFWGQYDASRVAIWKRIYSQIRATDPTAYVILEHFADDREEAELTNAGMLVWDNQNGGVREAVKNGGGSFSRLAWNQHAGFTRPASIGYMESHDEQRIIFDAVTNGGTSPDGYTVKNLATALERTKAAAVMGLLTPGPKLIWQFGELGYDISIDQNGRTGQKPIRWTYYQDPNRLKLFKVFAEAIKLKTTNAAFRSTDFVLEASSTVVKRLTINSPTLNVRVVANFGLLPQSVSLPVGRWYDYFTGQEFTITDGQTFSFLPGQFHLLTNAALPKPEAGLTPWTLQVVTATEPVLPVLTLSPNPTRDLLTARWNSGFRGQTVIRVQSLSGQTVQEITTEKATETATIEIGVSKLAAGAYVLTINENGEKISQRWVKL
jgi:glycosidase